MKLDGRNGNEVKGREPRNAWNEEQELGTVLQGLASANVIFEVFFWSKCDF